MTPQERINELEQMVAKLLIISKQLFFYEKAMEIQQIDFQFNEMMKGEREMISGPVEDKRPLTKEEAISPEDVFKPKEKKENDGEQSTTKKKEFRF